LSESNLKGQCHKMVVKMSPWSSSLGTNQYLWTLFFHLKIGLFKLCSTEWRTHRCKTGTLDMAAFATTRIRITLFFVAYCRTSLWTANVPGLILCELPQLYKIKFFGDHCSVNLADYGIATVDNKLRFPHCFWIQIFLNISWPLKEDRAMNFQSRSPSCGKIRQIWEPWFYVYL
jgi:hypothetical protein